MKMYLDQLKGFFLIVLFTRSVDSMYSSTFDMAMRIEMFAMTVDWKFGDYMTDVCHPD